VPGLQLVQFVFASNFNHTVGARLAIVQFPSSSNRIILNWHLTWFILGC